MHPAIRYEMSKARVADLHHQAQRDALARAARRPGQARGQPSGHRLPALRAVLARRLLTVLGARTSP